MAGTYLDMQNRIQDEVQDTALLPQIKLAIQTAISYYERTRFYFNTKTATWNTVGGQEYYGTAALADIPNLIRIFDPMKCQITGFNYDIWPTDEGYINSAQNGQIVTRPQYYAYYGQQIRLFPIPDTAYLITMQYHYRLQTLVNDADTNAWMTDGEMLIRQCAKRVLGVDVTREVDPSQPPSFMEQQALDAIQAETRARMSNGLLAVEYKGAMGRGRFNIYTGY